MLGLLPELEVAVVAFPGQLSALERRRDCAAGLRGVRAVGEAALQGQLADLRETHIQPVGRAEQAELPHPRGVDQERPAVEEEQLPPRRRVHALAGRADGPRLERLPAEQAVDERRLPDARGAEQAVRPSGGERGAEVVHPGARCGAKGEDPPGEAGAADRRDLRLQLAGGDEVGLRQENDRLDPPVVCRDEVAVEPPQVEVVAAGLDDERRVDVRGDHLEVHVPSGGLAAQEGLSRENGVDDRRAVRLRLLHADPVADAGEIDRGRGREAQPPRQLGGALSPRTANEKGATIDRRHAGDALSRLEQGAGALLEPAVEAERGQFSVHVVRPFRGARGSLSALLLRQLERPGFERSRPPVDAEDHTRARGGGSHERHRRRDGTAAEEPLARADQHRKDQQPVLVDQVALDQRLRKLAAAVDLQLARKALLERGHFRGGVPHEEGVVPRERGARL